MRVQLDLPSHSAWTSRDLAILECLAMKTRTMSVVQIARLGWNDGPRQIKNATQRLKRLSDAGLVLRYRVNVHPMIAVDEPIYAWKPGESAPDFPNIAWELKQRWKLPAEPQLVVTASKRTANLFASYSGPIKDPIQATHDIHLTEVYLRYRAERPWFADRWVGEDTKKKAGFGIKDPDAFLVDRDGEIREVIEFGGRYSAERIRDFHEHCRERDLPYKLW